MINKKRTILYVFLAVSLLGNVLTLLYDVFPTTYPKIKNKYFTEETLKEIDSNTKNLVFEAAIRMAKSSKVEMIWDESEGLMNKILNFGSITSQDEFKKYNYPRAYLFYGISCFLISENKADRTNEFKVIFDELIDENGNSNFEINRVDQVPFGLVSLNLYKIYGEKKYLIFSEKLYQYTVNAIDAADCLVLYRKDHSSVLNDVLGMVVPFLIEYSKISGEDKSLEIAQRQMEYFINYGVDKETFLPSHAINREHLVKVGSSNWGRGIGWYYFALSYFYKETTMFEKEYKELTKTLLTLKNSEGLWSQFPGSSESFDASSTTMFLYSMILNTPESFDSNEVLYLLKEYISSDGVILQTSGDTYATNRYSNAFGKSELSQGMLLLILSLSKEKK